MVCTDIASRGIDFIQVSSNNLAKRHSLLMLNAYPPPPLPFTYAHTWHTYPQVTHVVLFDFPTTIADYLHRVGRTGRVGSVAHCKATAFMAHRRDIRTVWKIKVEQWLVQS